jgi:DNA-binding MarR family transcriptional regulator
VTDAIVIANPWTPYGLREDPYFQQALDPVLDEHAGRPATLHVGRAEALTEIATQIVSGTQSTAIIHGDAGVGKTSFVSRLKATLSQHGVLSHTNPVRVQQHMSPRDFLGEVLRVLLLIRATDRNQQPEPPAKSGWRLNIGRKAPDPSATAAWKSSSEEDAFWVRVGRLVEGEDSLAGGVTVGTVGMQHERIRIPAELPKLALFTEVEQALHYLSHDGARRILIHVNNMERLSPDSTAHARAMMADLRDAFLFLHSHWLFVGTTGIDRTIFGDPTLSSFMTLRVALPPLSVSEVVEVLRRRYQHLQQGIYQTPPVADDAARTLYARYHGQLRGFLGLLSRAVQRRALRGVGVPLTAADVIEVMADAYWERAIQGAVGKHVTPATLGHLRALLYEQPCTMEFRATDLVRATSLTPAAATKILQELVKQDVIALVRHKGQSKYYRLTDGDLTIALRMT